MDATVEVEDSPESSSGNAFSEQPNGFLPVALLLTALAAVIFCFAKRWLCKSSPARGGSLNVEVELTEDAIKRREAIEAARIRMQERFNRDAEQFRQKMLDVSCGLYAVVLFFKGGET